MVAKWFMLAGIGLMFLGCGGGGSTSDAPPADTPNAAPVAVNDAVTTDEDVPLTSAVSLSANDTDSDGDALGVTAGTFATSQGGTIVIAADGSYFYTPAPGFYGTDTVAYTVSDGSLSDTGTLTVTVNLFYARGVNIPLKDTTLLSESDVARWATWGVNTVRIMFNKDDTADPYSDAPTAENIWLPYTTSKTRLSQWLTWLETYDIKAMITLDGIWGDDHGTANVWGNGGDNDYLNHRIALAGEMALFLKTYPNARYLEVWNEPHPYDDLYKTLFLPAALASVADVNNTVLTPVCMAPSDWGMIQGFNGWDGAGVDGVVYSTHFYTPWTYTHQGISGNPLDAVGWPGLHKDYPASPLADYNITWVRDRFAIATDFMTRSGAKVMVTEFGAVRWAIDADRYIDDLITVFEENDMEWVYHAMGGWNGWNATFESNATENFDAYGGSETQTLTNLKSYWSLN